MEFLKFIFVIIILKHYFTNLSTFILTVINRCASTFHFFEMKHGYIQLVIDIDRDKLM